jgi:hypothetical protein
LQYNALIFLLMLHTYHKPANTSLVTVQHQLIAMHHVLASDKHMLQCQQQTASHVQVSSCMGPANLAIGQLLYGMVWNGQDSLVQDGMGQVGAATDWPEWSMLLWLAIALLFRQIGTEDNTKLQAATPPNRTYVADDAVTSSQLCPV